MRRLVYLVIVFMLTLAALTATAESYLAPTPDELRAEADAAMVGDAATEPFTWSYLATVAGCAAATLLIVQFFKVPLDRVWRIPTRVFVYVVALIVMLAATYFASALTLESAALAALNAFLAAMAAMGAYEVTFAKINK